MKLAAFFHLFASGTWHEPLADYLAALDSYDGPLTIGLVGTVSQRREAEAAITRPHLSVYAETGWEQVTLDAVWHHALWTPGAVMYAHTKGSSCTDPIEVPWRRKMLQAVVRDWEANLIRLEKVQAVGCHWLTPREFPDLVDNPFFGGNFWMARCDYVRDLASCSRASRGQAEVWIGRGKPTVEDLYPGWPSYPT